MIKRNGSLILVLILSILMFSGCGGQNSQSQQGTVDQSTGIRQSTAENAAQKPLDGKTVTFSTFNQWYNVQAGLKEGLAKCEELTGAKIDVSVYPDDQYENVLNTKLAAGETEDFFSFYDDLQRILAPDRLEPLDGTWADTVRKDSLAYVTRKSDGKIVGAPYGDTPCIGAIYNKKIFKDAGIKTPINNYQEFINACNAIKKLGVTPVFLPNKDVWTAQILMLVSMNSIFENAPSLAEKIQKNQIEFQNVQPLMELSNRAYSLVAEGFLNDNYLSADFNMADEAVATGKAGMFFGGSWLYTDIASKYPDQVADTGMTPVTLSDNGLSVIANASGSAFFVPVDSKNKDAAKLIINTFVSGDVLNTVADKFTAFAVDSNFKNKMNPWVQEMKGYVDSGIPLKEQFSFCFFPSGFDCGDYAGTYQAIFSGKDIKNALTDWYKDMAAKNKAKKIPGF